MDLWELFRSWSESMIAPLRALRQIPHSGEKGSAVEQVFRQILTHHLPGRFSVGSGFVLGVSPARSRQLDVVVYDALDCPIMLSSEVGLYPVDSVVAAFEVTTNLDAGKLRKDCETLAGFRTLALSSPRPPHAGLADPAPLGFCVGFGTDLDLKRLAEEFYSIVSARWRDDEGPQLPNGVLVLDKGVLMYFDEKQDGTRVFHFHPPPFRTANSTDVHEDTVKRRGVLWWELGEYGIGVWYPLFLTRVRILLENRVRAQAEWLIRTRRKMDPEQPLPPATVDYLDSPGASVLIPSLEEYFPGFYDPRTWPQPMQQRQCWGLVPEPQFELP